MKLLVRIKAHIIHLLFFLPQATLYTREANIIKGKRNQLKLICPSFCSEEARSLCSMDGLALCLKVQAL